MSISAIELVVIAFASYRLTRLVVEDTIADPVRDWVIDRLLRKHTKLRHKLVDLITCIYCAGWWVSGLMLFAYLAATSGWPGIVTAGLLWFAVAGAQALLNTADQAMAGGDES